MSARGRTVAALVTGAALVGFGLVLVVDQRVLVASGIPLISYSTAYVAAWVAVAGMRSWPGVVLAGVVAVTVGMVLSGPQPASAAVGIAAVAAGAAGGAVVRLLGVTMHRPPDPGLIELVAVVAGALTGIGWAGAAGLLGDPRAQFMDGWSAATTGMVATLPAVLAFRRRGAVTHPAEFAVVAVLLVVAVVPVAPVLLADTDIGLLAWLTLPVLLLMGLRYGVFAAALGCLVSSAVTVIGTLQLPQPVRAGDQLQRQLVGALLVFVVLTIVLLLREQRRALARQRAEQEVIAGFLAHSETMWYVKAIDGAGSRYVRLGGGPFRELRHMSNVTDEELFGAHTAELVDRADRELLASGEPSTIIETLPMPGGHVRTTLSNRFPIRDAGGRITAIGGTRTDVSEREALAAMQAQQRRLLEAMFARSPVPTLRLHRDDAGMLRVAAANEAFGRVVGRDPADLAGVDAHSLVVPEDWRTFDDLIVRDEGLPASTRWSPQAEVRIHTRIGGHRRGLVTVARLDVAEPGRAEFLVHMEDVTARRAAEEAVAWYSLFDARTGLLNRTAMGDKLDAALHRVGENEGGVALITIDVDDFKTVNDSHGHGAGDLVLVEYGTRIQRVCDSRDSVARLSADEFAVLVEWDSKEQVAVFVGRLQSALAEPVVIGDGTVSCTSSFGVTLTRDAEMTASELVRQAELALFRAKRLGRARVEFYAESMRAQAQAALNVRNELAQAVAKDGFLVAYQPIVELDTGQVVGFESLVRLPTRDGRVLGPDEFLEVARSADLVTQIDRLVLRQSLSDLAADRLAVPGVGLSVNAEPDDLHDADFSIQVLSQLHAFEVNPQLLTVEVTEAALLEYDDAVMGNIASLRDAGVRFAIDDFGTGYSSLAQLRRLDADVIKIDRSFVTGMEHDPEDANIVATVIGLAHRLGLVAVAEGVETREQAETLRRLGCDRGQGYLFGHPQPIDVERPVVTLPQGAAAPASRDTDQRPQPPLD